MSIYKYYKFGKSIISLFFLFLSSFYLLNNFHPCMKLKKKYFIKLSFAVQGAWLCYLLWTSTGSRRPPPWQRTRRHRPSLWSGTCACSHTKWPPQAWQASAAPGTHVSVSLDKLTQKQNTNDIVCWLIVLWLNKI